MRCAHLSSIFFLYSLTLGSSYPILTGDKHGIRAGPILLPREPIPAPPLDPSHGVASNPVTPPRNAASLPVTPPSDGSEYLPATPANHVYKMIDVTPSHSGSPYDARRFKGQATNVKSTDLKSTSYRKTALKKATLENAAFEVAGNDADHLLEPQTVAFYLNQHRTKKVSVGCKEAIAEHLNHESNLQMLNPDHNKRKLTVVQGLLRAKDPKKSRQARPFSKVVANHVLKNKAAILETADKIDRLFESNGACKEIKGGNRKGINRAAAKMIHHAEKSKIYHKKVAAEKAGSP